MSGYTEDPDAPPELYTTLSQTGQGASDGAKKNRSEQVKEFLRGDNVSMLAGRKFSFPILVEFNIAGTDIFHKAGNLVPRRSGFYEKAALHFCTTEFDFASVSITIEIRQVIGEDEHGAVLSKRLRTYDITVDTEHVVDIAHLPEAVIGETPEDPSQVNTLVSGFEDVGFAAPIEEEVELAGHDILAQEFIERALMIGHEVDARVINTAINKGELHFGSFKTSPGQIAPANNLVPRIAEEFYKHHEEFFGKTLQEPEHHHTALNVYFLNRVFGANTKEASTKTEGSDLPEAKEDTKVSKALSDLCEEFNILAETQETVSPIVLSVYKDPKNCGKIEPNMFVSNLSKHWKDKRPMHRSFGLSERQALTHRGLMFELIRQRAAGSDKLAHEILFDLA